MTRTVSHSPGVDGGPRCTITELPQAWCDHCIERAIRQRRSARLNAAKAYYRNELTEVFAARFAGHCCACAQPFSAGSWVGLTQDEQYLCEECAQ